MGILLRHSTATDSGQDVYSNFVQIMWKYLEQASFPLTEAQYQEHKIEPNQEHPRLGKAVSIQINLAEIRGKSLWALHRHDMISKYSAFSFFP